ncbi:MAG TPA: TonB-dependent receptor [Gemmatimonadaceae bacterium]|nr:TonB-dependent receptor [Gemmatimonadaceae bacterium]
MRAARIAAAAFLAASPAAAQRPDTTARDTTRLPAVEVLGSILGPAGPRIGSGVPAATTVLDGSHVRAWHPPVLSEALAGAPGISLYDDLGSPYKTTLVTRGFTASPVVGLSQGVSVFIDGIPVNEPDAGQVNFDLLPLDHVRRIELMSGTASLLGPYSLAGAINLVTHRGSGPLEGTAQFSAGSYGAYSGSGSGSLGGEAGGWSYYGGGGYQTDLGWRQVTSATQYNALVNLSRARERGGISVQAFGASSYAETAGSLPESVYGDRPDSNLTGGDFEDLTQLHLAVFGWRELERGRATLGVWFREHDAERFNVNQELDPDVRAFSENRTIGTNADWRATFSAGEALLGLRVGATGSVSSTSVRIFAERIDPGLTTHVSSPIQEVGGYAIADWIRGPLTLSAGSRLDVIRIPFRNRLDSTRDTTSLYIQRSPRGGVSWAVHPGATVYASVGRSFRAPAVIELACADPEEPCPLPFALGDDPPLDPVTATTVEAGGRWVRGALTVGASVYRTEVGDEIFLFPYADESEPEGSTIDGFFANVARTRREGVELTARVQPLVWARAHASAAWTSATFRTGDIELFSIREEAGADNEVEIGDRMPLVPDRILTAGADLDLPRGLRAGIETRHVGRRFLRGDESNEEPQLPAHTVAIVRLGASFGDWEVQGIVRNAFDVRYATFGTFNIHQAAGGVVERFLTPGAPRTVQVSVRRRWGA